MIQQKLYIFKSISKFLPTSTKSLFPREHENVDITFFIFPIQKTQMCAKGLLFSLVHFHFNVDFAFHYTVHRFVQSFVFVGTTIAFLTS